MPKTIHVAVAVIENANSEICISFRHKNAHQGNRWEFPGGKIEQSETVNQALVREIKEELNLDIESSRPLMMVNHRYDDCVVCLHVCKVIQYQGVAEGMEGQEIRWIPVSQLPVYDFPAANLAIIKAVQLPDRYLITGKFKDDEDFFSKLNNALDRGIRLIQLRLKDDAVINQSSIQPFLERVATSCQSVNADLMLNLSTTILDEVDLSAIPFSGLHADSRLLNSLQCRPEGHLFSASCHNQNELMLAKRLQADFVVLSPVQKTASHPEMDAMGWQQFSFLVEAVPVPVFALGGVSESDLETAWAKGAQGIAAISALWEGGC